MRHPNVLFTATAACLVMLAGAPVPAGAQSGQGTTAFREDFESGLGRWEMTDPDAWAIVEEPAGGNHVLALQKASDYEPTYRSPYNIALLKDHTFGSFEMTVRLKQTGRDYNHRDLCLFFGYQDPAHYYYIHMATKADEHAHSVFIVNGAARRTIAEWRTEGTEWGDGYHTVKLRRDAASGAVEVFFDDMDKPIMKATDTTFGAGRIGLGSFDDVGQFDDLEIVKLDGDEATTK